MCGESWTYWTYKSYKSHRHTTPYTTHVDKCLAEPLERFLPPVAQWFQEALGEPTPAQRQGWPRIAAGEHTLILAPTGSGKTLAAFLACLDALWRADHLPQQVHVLYVSPLKALNNDIHKNLQLPLAGIAETARRMNHPLRELTAAVRTGDTPTADRQRLARKPPHVLITTPESLNLILTSQARAMLSGLRYCIVDEIHALCPNKRGVFLSLLLERLEALNPQSFVRIGLSATQRPLDEVARFLGGSSRRNGDLLPRPVAIVDAGLRKDLDLRVVSPVPHFGPLPERSIWPAIYQVLDDEIRRHRSTIIFTNNRRTAERVTSCLNELTENSDVAGEPDAETRGHGDAGTPESSAGVNQTLPASPRPRVPVSRLARAHHGSVSLEVRRQIEEALKEGRLPAVVATASLELGIDMGAVDLVCQVESPGSVARGLQRVGRAGHLVGRQSKGRLIAKTLPDLLEQAVLAREMLAGRVEEIRVPGNCLDVLAQQVVAMVAVESWRVPELYALVRQSYAYRDLTPEAFESVLEMISGRYPAEGFRDLRPRISWDRVHNRLHALPGSRQLALVNGGTIPDTGQYAAYIAPPSRHWGGGQGAGAPSPPWGRGQGEGVRIGELDEEFVYERRIGDAFVLGTTPWRIEQIEADRVYVSRAQGVPALMPFWRGEKVARSLDLGLALGRFLRELAERLPRRDCLEWLQSECCLDADAARNLRDYVKRQIEKAGCLPTDRTLLIESFRDQLGDWHVAVLSPFGSRFNLALRLVVEARLRQRFGYQPQCLHGDDGLLLRLADVEEPPLDLLDDLTPDDAENLILRELIDSALFAIRFRQNAARALLLPRLRPDRRAPLYLQRLKARGLLQIARQHPSFPVIVETYRECLQDHLDLPRLQQLLKEIRAGEVQVVKRRAESPSPFAGSLLFGFTMAFMYDYDRVENRHDGARDAGSIDRSMLEQVLTPESHLHLLDPRAVQQVERRLRGIGRPPRSVEEMAEHLRRLGDLSATELEGPMPGFLMELEQAGRACCITLPRVEEAERWVLVEELPGYAAAFGVARPESRKGVADTEPTPVEDSGRATGAQEAAARILRRFLQTHALVSLEDILRRYPFEEHWASRQLEAWVEAGAAVELKPTQGQTTQWSLPPNLDQVQRGSLSVHRREVLTCPREQFAHFLLHWQHRHPRTRKQGVEGVRAVLHRLHALPLPAELWESTVVPGRVEGYQTRWLDELSQTGEWLWAAWGSQTDADAGPLLTAFLKREELPQLMSPAPSASSKLQDAEVEQVYEHLRQRGASFVVDLAQSLGLSPGLVRRALWKLLRRAVVTNDRYDVIRRSEASASETDPTAMPRLSLRRLRQQRTQRPEGRWSLIPWQVPDAETRAVQQAYLLLERYGIVARELAGFDPWLLPWRVLYEVLSRLEWTGEVRRGYFVEGLSGAQFALPEAAKELSECVLPARTAEPVILLNSLDPANLYGAASPFAVPGAEEEERAFVRRPGNWLAIRGGRPVLVVEGHGSRITTMPDVAPDDLAEAASCLRDLLKTGHGMDPRGKVSVEEWNGRPVGQTEGRELLETAGFLRDYQAMTLYAAWR